MNFDANDIQTKVKHPFQYIRYSVSILEHVLKMIRNLIKGTLEIGYAAELKYGGTAVTNFKEEFSKFEGKFRIIFMALLDLIEDVLNVISYDYKSLKA